MTTFKSITSWTVLGLIVATVIYSCKKVEQTTVEDEEDIDEVIHTEMQYFDFDKVNDLTAFFDSISNEHGIPRWSPDDDEDYIKGLSKCIEHIECFRQGECKYYPDSLVKQCISFLGHDCAVIANHSPGVDLTYAEWFLMLTAYYSPDITYLVQMQTPNHKAGILNFGSSYNFNPWWCYTLLKRSKGFEVRRIGGDETKVDKIFQIVANDNQLYYLCSNNSSMFEFLQVLFWDKGDNGIVLVSQCDSLPVDKWDDFEECYYNPDQMAWYCCNVDKNSGKRIPISQKPAMVLKLDGDKSCFTKKK